MERHSHTVGSFSAYFRSNKVAKLGLSCRVQSKQNVKDCALGNNVVLEALFVEMGYLEK
jgi:hypothetical protein